MRCDSGGKGSDNVWYDIMDARGRVNERIVVDILIHRYYGLNGNEEVETKASRSVGRVVLTLRQAPIRHLVIPVLYCHGGLYQRLLCKMHLICALRIGIFVHCHDTMARPNDSSVRGDGSSE
jgi:hypothetical protein